MPAVHLLSASSKEPLPTETSRIRSASAITLGETTCVHLPMIRGGARPDAAHVDYFPAPGPEVRNAIPAAGLVPALLRVQSGASSPAVTHALRERAFLANGPGAGVFHTPGVLHRFGNTGRAGRALERLRETNRGLVPDYRFRWAVGGLDQSTGRF